MDLLHYIDFQLVPQSPKLEELQTATAYTNKKNQIQSLSLATINFVEGWCQVTEILFSIATQQQLSAAQRQNILLNLSHDLLQKMTSCEALSEIKTLVSGTLLVLFINLRLSLTFQFSSTVEPDELLSSSLTNITMMKIILGHILQWILNSEASSQKVRTHLFGALLYFLSVISDGSSSNIINKIETINFEPKSLIQQLDNQTNVYNKNYGNVSNNYILNLTKSLSAETHERSRINVIMQVINSFGDKLMDVVCHSSSGGHDICKMLGFSSLNKILELDNSCDNSWLIYLSSRGYVRHMIDGLLESDKQLCSMLQSEPASLRPLYLYEAKMAMFCRLATTRLGAESLLENKILSCLAGMTVIDQHPDINKTAGFCDNESSDFLLSLAQRYQQIFLPMLNLCDALLTTLGTENQSCAIQICGFLQNHRETVELILRNATPNSSKLFLNEVSCLTAVIARSVNIGKIFL